MEQSSSSLAAPIYEGKALIVKVNPPDYRATTPDTDRSKLKADVTLRTDYGEFHVPIDRSRMLEFDEKAANGESIPIRIG